MQKAENIFSKAKAMLEEIVLYWKNPRPGEYVPYKEIVMLSVGWLAQYFVVQFSIGFSVGTAFAGAFPQALRANKTAKMIDNALMVFIQSPLWIMSI